MKSHYLTLSLVLLGVATTFAEPDFSLRREGTRLSLQLKSATPQLATLEFTTALNASSWQPRLTAMIGQEPMLWQESLERGAGFYRLNFENSPSYASNFRLIDHLGTAQELEYQHHEEAVVLVFVSADYLQDPKSIQAIKAVRDEFAAEHLTFWLVDADPDDHRDTIKSMSVEFSLGMPVLHDRSQLLAMDLGVSALGHAVLIDPHTFEILYRGPIAGHNGSAGTIERQFLTEALHHALEGSAIPTRLVSLPVEASLDVPQPANFDYAETIAPLFQKHCVACHSDGNIAPFAFDSHETLRDEAFAIKDQILTGAMPPWHADPLYGAFEDDLSLPQEDAAAMIAWLNAGAPRGDGPDPLAEAKPLSPFPWSTAGKDYPFTWPTSLGKPDLVLTLPKQTIKATGTVDYWRPSVRVQIPDGKDKWLSAAVILPGNRKVVHHCLVFDGPESKFTSGLAGFFAGYVPGIQGDLLAFPEGTGKRLKHGSTLSVQMHYATSGKTEKDETKIGFYFHDAPPERELLTRSAYSRNINIPPNKADVQVTASYTLSQNSYIYELNPHMHYRGSRFRYEARYPDGRKETLLSVPRFEFDWQRNYRFAEPLFVPAKTRIVCIGAYDNTELNHENPNPKQTVRFGLQSNDEMFIGYINYAVAR